MVVTKEVNMPVSLERERAAIEAEHGRLLEPRKKLVERERAQVMKMVDDAGLMKVDTDRLSALFDRIGALGFDETEKRLAS